MKNQVWANKQPARSLPVPEGTKSGDPVQVGDLVGVASTDRADSTTKPLPTGGVGHADGHAAVCVDGGYRLTVSGAVAGPGTPVYITGTGPFTLSTAEGGDLFGLTVPGRDGELATKPAADGPAVVQVRAQI